MTRGFFRRGQPLVALVLLLGSWVSARAMMWNAGDMPHVTLVAPTPAAQIAAKPSAASPPALLASAPLSRPASGMLRESAISVRPLFDEPANGDDEPVTLARTAIYPDSTPGRGAHAALPHGNAAAHGMSSEPDPGPAQLAREHGTPWFVALNRLPLAAQTAAPPGNAAPLPVAPAPHDKERRWSADGWMLWRRGGTQSLAGGLLAPSYGASQAGAVLRYRLAPASPHRPALFMRTTAALNGSNEREAAAGIQARPLARVPIVLAGEARVTSTPGRTMVRPAVFAITELPPLQLPLGFRGEAYAQGGYVGGRFATAFGDGQLRVDHRLFGLGAGDLRLGGGVWGGAQKGAARLDAGPSLIVAAPLGGSGGMRLGADWRFRVAGMAAPGSGPAVTLSAGF